MAAHAPVRSNPDAFRFETTVDPADLLGGPLGAGLPTLGIEYTDEALRAMRHAEGHVVEQTKREVRRRFEERGGGLRSGC